MNVREQTFDLFRRRGLTTMFANPGSTEVPFLTGLPDDLRFVLGLHEGTVVGMASGYAIGRGEPALVLLHTTAGLGTAVSGLATARVNRAPLVVVVGQQDRRHLAYEPFLAGRLDGPRGHVSGLGRAAGRRTGRPRRDRARLPLRRDPRGPALVIVPMGDWEEPADEEREPAAAGGTVLPGRGADAGRDRRARRLPRAGAAPALVVGAGADDPRPGRRSSSSPSSSRAGVPGAVRRARRLPAGPPAYQGVLPADRPACASARPLRRVLVVGARLPPDRVPGATSRDRCVADDPEVHRSPATAAAPRAGAA